MRSSPGFSFGGQRSAIDEFNKNGQKFTESETKATGLQRYYSDSMVFLRRRAGGALHAGTLDDVMPARASAPACISFATSSSYRVVLFID